jgi:hypothetical protein
VALGASARDRLLQVLGEGREDQADGAGQAVDRLLGRRGAKAHVGDRQRRARALVGGIERPRIDLPGLAPVAADDRQHAVLGPLGEGGIEQGQLRLTQLGGRHRRGGGRCGDSGRWGGGRWQGRRGGRRRPRRGRARGGGQRGRRRRVERRRGGLERRGRRRRGRRFGGSRRRQLDRDLGDAAPSLLRRPGAALQPQERARRRADRQHEQRRQRHQPAARHPLAAAVLAVGRALGAGRRDVLARVGGAN